MDPIPGVALTADVRIPMRPLSVSDYERMFDFGILAEGDRVELLKGQLSEVSRKDRSTPRSSSGSLPS